ncbi:hypothetical protein V8C26DRAFT_388857 [Trichoderma gracile]
MHASCRLNTQWQSCVSCLPLQAGCALMAVTDMRRSHGNRLVIMSVCLSVCMSMLYSICMQMDGRAGDRRIGRLDNIEKDAAATASRTYIFHPKCHHLCLHLHRMAILSCLVFCLRIFAPETGTASFMFVRSHQILLRILPVLPSSIYQTCPVRATFHTANMSRQFRHHRHHPPRSNPIRWR